MELHLIRTAFDTEALASIILINGKPSYASLENITKHIPEGRYPINMRYEGSMYPRYLANYKTDGMIWVRDVPDRTFIYIHIGNWAKHSDGCILIAREASTTGGIHSIHYSTDAYKEFHALIKKTLQIESIFLTIS